VEHKTKLKPMKKIKIFNVWAFSLALIAMLTIASCKKNTEISGTDETSLSAIAAEDDAVTDAVYNDVFDDVMGADNEVGLSGTGFLGGRSANGETVTGRTGQLDSLGGFPCLVVTRERLNPPNLFPIKITFDFGAGCVGRNGQFRKGKIVTIYTGRLIVPGSIATTTFVNYQVDSFKIEGTHIIKNLSTPQDFIYEVGLNNGKITNVNNGKYMKREALHFIKQVNGLGTPFFPLDDVFQITGGARGETNRSGAVILWGRTILPAEPVIKKYACHWFVEGKVKIERSNAPTALLDYGNGNCDNLATITVNGNTRVIVLPW
jgi:hypothetical protein